MGKTTVIYAAELYDGVGFSRDKTIELSGGQIASVRKGRPKKYDAAGIVTPAFIDAHSHIGMFRAGEPGGEAEGNDTTQQIMPLLDPLNSVYFDDQAFSDAVDFGVLYSCIMPGSGNLFGGRSRIIKNFARHKGEALYADFGYKMALGYNPRSTQGWKGERPNTRMGIYAQLERRFDEVLAKERRAELARDRKRTELGEKKDLKAKERSRREKQLDEEFALEFNPEDNALLDVLHARTPVKVHVHKQDDVIYLIELVKRYGLRVSAEHTSDVWTQEIYEMLAENEIPVIFGPLGTHAYKVELRHFFYQNAKLLMESGVRFGLMTDHPVVHVMNLRDCLKFFLIQGMKPAEAIALITSRNADILGVGDRIGRVAEGYEASLLVWPGDPLHLTSHPRAVFAAGDKLRG